MCNEDETIWITFNGEIYNYPELKTRLTSFGHLFRSMTDTEVILHLYEQYDMQCLQYLRGMFAFAIWDAPRQRLVLARDRVGIKPLYYCLTPDTIWFASELKSLLSEPAVRGIFIILQSDSSFLSTTPRAKTHYFDPSRNCHPATIFWRSVAGSLSVNTGTCASLKVDRTSPSKMQSRNYVLSSGRR